jgi:glycosyltransferase involved in cell wall biosynthesis
MKVWLDGQCFQTASRQRGIGRYALELIRALVENYPKIELLISFNAQLPMEAISARDVLSKYIPSKNIHVWNGIAEHGEGIIGLTPARLLSEIALVHHVNCLEPDVALSLSIFEGGGDKTVPLLPSSDLDAPAVGIFYDAIPWHFKSRYLLDDNAKNYYRRRLQAYSDFSEVLCISQFSVDDVMKLIENVSATNISAGISEDFTSPSGGRQHVNLGNDDPFILYVGGLDWRKNVKIIPEAIANLPTHLRDKFNFVIAGDNPSQSVNEIAKAWVGCGLDKSKFQSVGYATDGQLLDLYKRAALVVQPSLMEGFGLTTLEALVCGTPVIASNIGAMSEVLGVDRLLFDPTSPLGIANSMASILQDEELRHVLKKRSLIAKKVFKWSATASKTVNVLTKTVSKKKFFKQEVDFLRDKAVLRVASLPISRNVIAQILSSSEPQSQNCRRLILDVSNTITSPAKTGIQRVVRRICEEIPEVLTMHGIMPVLAHCVGSEGGWRSSNTAEQQITEKLIDFPSVQVTQGDDLLLIDSSWHFSDIHRRFLIEARLRGCEVNFVLYDQIPLTGSAFCLEVVVHTYQHWLLAGLELATSFICISKAVADELYNLLETINFPRPMKIGYWRLGADFICEKKTTREKKIAKSAKRPSFLMVGTLEPRKSHSLVLSAFEQLWAEGQEFELVIVGKVGWETSELAARIRSHPQFGQCLFWHESVSDEGLVLYYQQTDALIAASYSEGFGLPLIEAGYFGKPAIASDIPVFREAAKGAADAYFFERGSSSELAKTILKFVSKIKSKKSITKPKKLSWPNWKESAEELCEVVVKNKWYKVYQPSETKLFVPLQNIGTTQNSRGYYDLELLHKIELVEGPVKTSDGSSFKITVSVTNNSSIPWFGAGKTTGEFAIGISYHTLDANLKSLTYDNPRTRIPLVLRSGDTHYMAVNIPIKKIVKAPSFVDIELVQEAVAWWGSPLRVALPTT